VTIERRLAARRIKRVLMQITLGMDSSAESVSADAMNISESGAYFSTSRKLREGVKLELRLKIPEEINPSRPSHANSLAAWRTSNPSVTMACPASTSSMRLLTDAPLASPAAAALFLFPLCFFCFYLSSLCPLCSRRPMWKSPYFLFLPGTRSLCALLFSTDIHKFAQTFLRNLIDAENGKVYLPPQIEPEA
jgi:hypothetical protein